MDKAILASDELEKKLVKRLDEIYRGALKTAINNEKDFFNELKKIDEKAKKLPNDWDESKIKAWKSNQQKELLRKKQVVKNISKDIANTGKIASKMIQNEMGVIYGINQKYTADLINNIVKDITFTIYDKKQLQVLLNDSIPPFSKLAYKNLGNDSVIVKRLNNELAQATILGESQEKIINRIIKVTGQSQKQAKRVAQTERNRIQSQARYETMGEAYDKGVQVKKKWTARMINSRETHAMLNGTIVNYDEDFVTIQGNTLRFPGDPTGVAEEVINCYCVLIPKIELRK